MIEIGEKLELNKRAWRVHVLKTSLGMTDADIEEFLPPDADSDTPRTDTPHSSEVPDADDDDVDPTDVPTGTLSRSGKKPKPDVEPGIPKDREVSDLSEGDQVLREMLLHRIQNQDETEIVRRSELPTVGGRKQVHRLIPFEIPKDDR